MNNNRNSALQQWQESCQQLLAIDSAVPQEKYNEAIALCAQIHSSWTNRDDCDNCITFLSTYANLCAMDERHASKEIDIQEEIVELRRKQAATNREKHLSKLSHSLFYAAQLHRKATNVHRAMECMEEHLDIERALYESNPANSKKDLAVALYFMANTYAAFGRNILAEDTYIEAIATFDEMLDSNSSNNDDMALLLAQIIIEFADFHLASRMIDKAIDRYIQALELLRTLSPDNQAARTLLKEQYGFMSTLYAQVGNNDMSHYYAQLKEDIN